jgi:hypothetical protein
MLFVLDIALAGTYSFAFVVDSASYTERKRAREGLFWQLGGSKSPVLVSWLVHFAVRVQ